VSQATLLVVSALMALTVALSVGLRTRTSDLAFERRSLDRLCARWSAESGLAHLQAEIGGGRRPAKLTGSLPPGPGYKEASYQVSAAQSAAGLSVTIDGRCVPKEGRATISRLSLAIGPGPSGWHVKKRRELTAGRDP
jgi:hypothetical protein